MVPAAHRIVHRLLILQAVMMTLVVFGAQATVAALPSEGAGDPGLYVTQMEHFYYLPLAFNVSPAGVIQGTLVHDGMQREYILYVPTSYTGANPAPLILNYHAYARDALVQMAYGDFRPVAELTGAIVVHPQGAIWNGSRRWNVGGLYTHPLADDVGFTEAVLDAVSATYHIDPERIYSAGFSNGAYMSYLVACQLSQRIAAVAAVAGTMTPEMQMNCRPERPLAVLHIHGLDDSVVPYAGEALSASVDDVIAYWIANNMSSPEPVVQQRPDYDPFDGSTVTHLIHEAGEIGVNTELLRISGGGHSWPGTAAPDLGLPAEGTNYDIDASAEIWDFFARYDINGIRATSGERLAASDEQRATSSERRAASDQQLATGGHDMSLDLNSIEIHENDKRRRFEAQVGEHTAVMYRYYNDDSLVITHTLVPDELAGQGLAGHITRTVLDEAREKGLSVVPICPYVAAYIKRHPEYEDLLQKGPDQ